MAELLEIEAVTKTFPQAGGLFAGRSRRLSVLNGVDLVVAGGETIGLVGESGCGKSTLARLVVGLTAASSGEIRWRGTPIRTREGRPPRSYYDQVQMVFQDPYSSLNPRHRAGRIVGEMLRIRGRSWGQARAAAAAMLERLGLDQTAMNRYPHQFSGGQRQRIALARALVVQPQLLIADEPVSALDLATQAQILDLLASLRRQLGLTVLLISHDLMTVAGCCDRVAVMYLGRLVEILPAGQLLEHGVHPYLEALIASVPVADPRRRGERPPPLGGEVPGPHDLPAGCAFHPRCALRIDRCSQEVPEMAPRGSSDHLVACHCV
jgi:peptide/nickel transport system ATP-binding protein/oligopeptide transport system ATP-binding protein